MRAILLFVLFSLSALTAPLRACDACGCGLGSGGFGLLGLYRSNFVGLQYSYAGFRSFYTSGEPTGTQDGFHAATLAVRFSPLDRLRIDASLPYQFNRRTSPDRGRQSLDGLSDLRIGAAYVLLQDQRVGKSDSKLYLEAGLQAVIPTGRYEEDMLHDHYLPDNFSPGRGAYGLAPRLLAALSGNRFGTVIQVEGQLHGRAEDGYRYGNEIRAAWQVYSEHSLTPTLRLVPFLGVQYDYAAANEAAADLPVHATGGRALLARAGFQVRLPRITLGCSAGTSLWDNFAGGEVAGRARLAAEVYYAF